MQATNYLNSFFDEIWPKFYQHVNEAVAFIKLSSQQSETLT
jgi:hypothetical protein